MLVSAPALVVPLLFDFPGAEFSHASGRFSEIQADTKKRDLTGMQLQLSQLLLGSIGAIFPNQLADSNELFVAGSETFSQ